MLLLDDRTRGDVKGLCGVGSTPMLLLTRNPDVKTLGDFSGRDKIALPSVKVSSQAVLLQIAVRKAFGPEGANRLDPLTVQLGHPDAVAALASPRNEVNSHFSLPALQQRELQDPAIHAVLNSYEPVGEPVSDAILYARTAWYARNPELAAAIVAAIDEASAAIARDPLQAARDYVAATSEKTPPETLVAIMKEPGTTFTTPYGIMLQARHFYAMKTIRAEPKDWKEGLEGRVLPAHARAAREVGRDGSPGAEPRPTLPAPTRHSPLPRRRDPCARGPCHGGGVAAHPIRARMVA